MYWITRKQVQLLSFSSNKNKLKKTVKTMQKCSSLYAAWQSVTNWVFNKNKIFGQIQMKRTSKSQQAGPGWCRCARAFEKSVWVWPWSGLHDGLVATVPRRLLVVVWVVCRTAVRLQSFTDHSYFGFVQAYLGLNLFLLLYQSPLKMLLSSKRG